MVRADLARLGGWIAAPHVQTWWREPSDQASLELAYGSALDGADPTELFIATDGDRSIGFAQRCLLRDNRDYEAALAPSGTEPGAATIDYLIGEPELVGQGLGTVLVRRLVAGTWRHHPDVPAIVVAVQCANVASWRVLEKAGFARRWTGLVDSGHPSDDGPSYVYALSRPSRPGDDPTRPA